MAFPNIFTLYLKDLKASSFVKVESKLTASTFKKPPKTMRTIIIWNVSDQVIHGMNKSKLPASSAVVPSVFAIHFSNRT